MRSRTARPEGSMLFVRSLVSFISKHQVIYCSLALNKRYKGSVCAGCNVGNFTDKETVSNSVHVDPNHIKKGCNLLRRLRHFHCAEWRFQTVIRHFIVKSHVKRLPLCVP